VGRAAIGIGILLAIVAGLYRWTSSPSPAAPVDPKSAVASWNNKAVELHARCERAFGPLPALMAPYFAGRAVDGDVLDPAFQTFRAEAHIAARELGFLTPPDDPACRAFHHSLGEYVRFQASLAAELGDLVEHMKHTAPATADDIRHAGDRLRDLSARAVELDGLIRERQEAVQAKYGR
jgi:hypothetical protein